MTDTVSAPAAATAQGPRKIDQLVSEIASENNATNGNAQAQSILLSWIKELRIDLSFSEGVGVKKAIITIPVKKPGGQDFIRVHPSTAFRLPVAIIELRDDRETFLVLPDIARDIPGECNTVTMYTCINRQGVVFLWPVRLPGSDGRQLEWHRSAAKSAEIAMKRWVRVKANMSLGAYEPYEAPASIPEPAWPPDLTFEQMLTIAFKGRLVDSFDHPVLKRLRGET